MEYIDLGLPSGTLWAEQNEDGYYTFNKAVAKFGDDLPTKEDFEELLKHCWKRWDDERKGVELMGDNGAKLFFPALGFRYGAKEYGVQDGGYYWSATYNGTVNACSLLFGLGMTGMYYDFCYYERTVRLIKRGGTK